MRRVLLVAGAGASLRQRWIPLATILGYLDDGFTKNAGNPVLPKGSSGQWDDYGVRELTPVIDEQGLLVYEPDGLWAYYAGFPDSVGTDPWNIGLAKSMDDGVTWTKYGSNPVVVPAGAGWYQNDVTQPSVVKLDDGSYVMLATGRDSGDVDSIGCLSSADGLTWVDEGQKLDLSDFLDGATAMVEIAVPNLLKLSSGTWLVIVECRKSGVTNGWRVFGATASDPTSTWTPLNSGQPLLSPTSGWESVGVANAHIMENTPGNYVLMYNGISSPSPNWQIGFAWGSSLTSWTRYSGNPVISKGSSGQWDDLQTETCYLPKEPTRGSLRVFYQGFDDPTGSMQVGMAETP